MIAFALRFLRGFARDFQFVTHIMGGLARFKIPGIRNYLQYHADDENYGNVVTHDGSALGLYLLIATFPILLICSLYVVSQTKGLIAWSGAIFSTIILGLMIFGIRATLTSVLLIVREGRIISEVDWWVNLLLLVLHIIAFLCGADLLLSISSGSPSLVGQLGYVIWDIVQGFTTRHGMDWRSLAEQLAPLSRVLIGMLCLLMLMIGIRWQAKTFLGDALTRQRRIKWALVVVGSCVSGAVVWAIFAFLDKRSTLTLLDSAKYVLGVGIVGVVFLFKTWIGPILLTAALSWSVYMLLVHGELSLIPVFDIMTKTFLGFAPAYASQFYVALTLLFSLFGSIFSFIKAKGGYLGS